MADQASTFNQPRSDLVHMHTQEEVQEEQMAMEEGIFDMLHDLFCDDLPHEEAGVLNEEAKNRLKREFEIKEQCNKMLYEGEKVSKVQILLSLLSLQSVYGWSMLGLF